MVYFSAAFTRILSRCRQIGDGKTIAASEIFHTDWYLDQNPDVRAAGLNPLAHYLRLGAAEGRDPHPLFETDWYLDQNPDVRAAGINPLVHYVRSGGAEDRDPNPLFDTDWYLDQYPDVRAAGINPLAHYVRSGGAEGRDPNPLFDGDFYIAQIHALASQTKGAGPVAGAPLNVFSDTANPLEHFIAVGSMMGLRPSEYFDPKYYLETNADIAAPGTNPLVHYLIQGATDQRRPSREFNAIFYQTQLSSVERARWSNPLSHYYAVGRTRHLRVNELYDLNLDASVHKSFVSNCANGRPTVLMVLHAWEGGADKHVRDIATLCRDAMNSLVTRPSSFGSIAVNLEEPHLQVRLYFDPDIQCEQLINFLRECCVARVHVHHLLGNEHYLHKLVKELALPFDFTLHDYYVLSPQPFLVGLDNRFVGEDFEESGEELLACSVAPLRPRSLKDWQASHRWLLTDAARIIVGSNDAARRVSAHVSGLQMVVAAHPEKIGESQFTNSVLNSDSRLRISVLGLVAPHKGLDVFLSCAKLAKARSDLLDFQIIGSPSSRHGELLDLGVEITGPYTQFELPLFIRECHPHLLWYPAQCPETYSYTLSEGLASGLPLAVANLGALPERVSGRPWIWIMPWDCDPEEWIKLFVQIRENNFARGVGPQPIGKPWPVTDEFYRREYFDWIQS